MSELNPNHPTTMTMHDHWHKIAAVLMRKFGLEHVVITAADINRIPEGNFIVLQELNDGLHLKFVDEKTAIALARREGGLPT